MSQQATDLDLAFSNCDRLVDQSERWASASDTIRDVIGSEQSRPQLSAWYQHVRGRISKLNDALYSLRDAVRRQRREADRALKMMSKVGYFEGWEDETAKLARLDEALMCRERSKENCYEILAWISSRQEELKARRAAPTRTGTVVAGSTRGKVRGWNDEKGFGFIRPEASRDDIFFHKSALSGSSHVSVGQTVLVEELELSERGLRAGRVTII